MSKKTSLPIQIFLSFAVFLAGLLFAACSTPVSTEQPDDQTAVSASPTSTISSQTQGEEVPQAPVTDEPVTDTSLPPPPEFAAQPLKTEKDNVFANAGVCTACHTIIKDSSGKDLSMETHWRSSIKAQSARDPYYLATVRSEIDEFPGLRDVIEDKCASCHMPMAATSIHFEGGKAGILDDGLLNPDTERHALAIEGVSCNLCHQIDAANFGEVSSFSGGYVIDPVLPPGERPAYGRFDMDKGSVTMMSGASGYLPVKSEHILQSQLCGTCHNLYTPYLDQNGEIAGEFPEQMIYSEWENSSYQSSATCQDCHMPAAPGALPLTALSTPPRQPYQQHLFQGGNAFMLMIYQYFGEELGINASSDQLKTTLNATQELLQTKTAQVTVENAAISGGILEGEIVIKNLAGHKFPAGYPSRRAWLHIQVIDSKGEVVFESGAYDSEGKILDNDNDLDTARFEPHYHAIDTQDQVQIYESILGNTQGQVTTTLLRGAQYLKDNRLLPDGFTEENRDILPDAQSSLDEDFQAGGDRVQLKIALESESVPLTLRVRVLFQSIGYRWAQNLAGFPSDEVTTFMKYYASIPNIPVVIAENTTEIK